MGFVRISPELGLLFDPLKGVVAEQREDVVLYTFDPVMDRIERLDAIADDLMNQLVPDNELLESYENRGKTSLIGGLYTNIWVGFIIGLVISFVVLIGMVFSDPAKLEMLRKAMGGA